MFFCFVGYVFFDAIADESRARLEVEFVNLSFGAVQIIFYGCLFCVGGEGERLSIVPQLAKQVGRR